MSKDRPQSVKLGVSLAALVVVAASVLVAIFVVRSEPDGPSAAVGAAAPGDSTTATSRETPPANTWVTDEPFPQPGLSPEEEMAEVAEAAQEQAENGLVPVPQQASTSTLVYASELAEPLATLGATGNPVSATDEALASGELNSRFLAWNGGDGATIEVIVNYLRQPFQVEAIGPLAEIGREQLADGSELFTYSTRAFAQAIRVFPNGVVVNTVTRGPGPSEAAQTTGAVAAFARQIPNPPSADAP